MVFSSLTFLFLFFPLVMLFYYLLPWRGYRNVLLLVFSLVFYAWGEPVYIVLMLLSSLAAYLGGLLMEHFRQRKAVCTFAFVVTVVLITVPPSLPEPSTRPSSSGSVSSCWASYSSQASRVSSMCRRKHSPARP